MSDTAVQERLESLTEAVEKLTARVEDLEDNRDLEIAMAENADKPLIDWESAKSLLDLD
ncbi:MAG: hypothetical protein KDL87_12285 [Verrucomicrobiae bacterium]|nr:hypothetical protein [Verrucomicrobiae bacterium]